MQTEINEPKEGDYFCIKKDGEDWPVVICDEEIIQTFFAQRPRPTSARQADGSWGKDYKAGGFSISEKSFPAINLGTMEFMWASLKEIEPIDLDMGRVIRSSTSNSLLAKAWCQYIAQYKGDQIGEWKELDHWKARLHAQRLEKAPCGLKKDKLPVGKKQQGFKRKGTPVFRYPPGYRNEEVDDEEPDDLFLPKEDIAQPKIKQEPKNSLSSDEIDALYDDPDPPYRTSSQSSKRSKLDVCGRFSKRPSTPLGANPSKHASLRHGTPSQLTNKNVDVNDPTTVIIYVDNPHKRFKVRRAGLETSSLLSNLLTNNPQNGWYIMTPILSSIDANDFQPIGEYIDRREYHPNILDDGTVHVRLEGDLTPAMLRHQIVRCGTVYQIAQMLDMPGLQDLAFRKLKALAPHYRPLEVLAVVESLFEISGAEMRRYLVEQIAGNFWEFVLAETEKLVEVMSGNEELARGVHGILSGVDGGVKIEEKVKDEVLPEIKQGEKKGEEGDLSNGEGKSTQLTDGAVLDNVDRGARCDSVQDEEAVPPANTDLGFDEYKPNHEGEGLSQAEKDMLRMAFRQSDDDEEGSAVKRGDEDKTTEEEDWVQLVRKQSEIFEAF